MKHLQLKVTETTRKNNRFTYEVIENGVTLYSTQTDRVYVAMIMEGTSERLAAAYRFGRLDLIGKGDSKTLFQSGNFYALALAGFNEKNPVDGPTTMVDDVTHVVFQVAVKDLNWLMDIYEEQGEGQRAFVTDLDGHGHTVRLTERFAKPAQAIHEVPPAGGGDLVSVTEDEFQRLHRAFLEGMEVCDAVDIYGDSCIVNLEAIWAPPFTIPVVTYEFQNDGGGPGFAVIFADGHEVGKVQWAGHGIVSSSQELTLEAVHEFAKTMFPGGFVLPYSVDGAGYVTKDPTNEDIHIDGDNITTSQLNALDEKIRAKAAARLATGEDLPDDSVVEGPLDDEARSVLSAESKGGPISEATLEQFLGKTVEAKVKRYSHHEHFTPVTGVVAISAGKNPRVLLDTPGDAFSAASIYAIKVIQPTPPSDPGVKDHSCGMGPDGHEVVLIPGEKYLATRLDNGHAEVMTFEGMEDEAGLWVFMNLDRTGRIVFDWDDVIRGDVRFAKVGEGRPSGVDFYRCRVCGNEFEEKLGKYGCCDEWPAILVTAKPVVTFRLITDFGPEFGMVEVMADGQRIEAIDPGSVQMETLARVARCADHYLPEGFVFPYRLDEQNSIRPEDLSGYIRPNEAFTSPSRPQNIREVDGQQLVNAQVSVNRAVFVMNRDGGRAPLPVDWNYVKTEAEIAIASLQLAVGHIDADLAGRKIKALGRARDRFMKGQSKV